MSRVKLSEFFKRYITKVSLAECQRNRQAVQHAQKAFIHCFIYSNIFLFFEKIAKYLCIFGFLSFF